MNAPAWLVTGASGFLGGYLMSGLAEAGFRVTGLGRRRSQKFPWIDADLTGPATIYLGPDHFDTVVHAAGLAHLTPRSAPERRRFFDVNTEGARKLLKALTLRPGPPESLVLISTVAVYGVTDGELLTESTPTRASDPYGASKLEAEQIASEWAQLQGVRLCILRLPLVYGEDPPGNLGAMSSAILRRRYAGIRPGTARRSIVAARDVAAILPRAAAAGGLYHLTDGEHPSLRQLELAFARRHGVRPPPTLPYGFAKCLAVAGGPFAALFGDRIPLNPKRFRKMTATLTFDDRSARAALGWNPTPVCSLI